MKKFLHGVDLEVVTMGDKGVLNGVSVPGMLKKVGRGCFSFQECSFRKRKEPLPRVYDGRYVSLVRHRDSRVYQLYFKQVTFAEKVKDPEAEAAKIYVEVAEALGGIGGLGA